MRSVSTIAALLAFSCLTNAASAQFDSSRDNAKPMARAEVRIQPVAPERYTLGVHVTRTPRGLEVTQVSWNSPASRLGLEAGDRIVQVNGRRIRSPQELERCLHEAAIYRNGFVRVLVDNVRARSGHHGAPRFVSNATYLDGFGGGPGHHDPYDDVVYTAGSAR